MEERVSDNWTEDLTDDDYCSVISSDCSVTAPPFSPIAGGNDNEDSISSNCSVTAPLFSPVAGRNHNEDTCLSSTCDELCKLNRIIVQLSRNYVLSFALDSSNSPTCDLSRNTQSPQIVSGESDINVYFFVITVNFMFCVL